MVLLDLHCMYSGVKSYVRHLNTISVVFFSSDVGIFQVEIMSPILFSFFLNDIEQNLQENTFDGITRVIWKVLSIAS